MALNNCIKNTLYYCGLCSTNVQADAMECSICKSLFHRNCAKLTKRDFSKLVKSGDKWDCNSCTSVFPFNGIDNDDFLFTQLSDNLSEGIQELFKDCSRFNVKTFKHTDYKSSARERNLDPDLNVYNSVLSDCNYYTDYQGFFIV